MTNAANAAPRLFGRALIDQSPFLAKADKTLQSVFADDQSVSLLLRMTLVLVIFHGFPYPLVQDSLILYAAPMIIFAPLARMAMLWLLIAFLGLISVTGSWATSDNHQYLLAYWLVCIFVMLRVDTPREERQFARLSATYLMAFTMFFAVVQKTLSPTYLSGAFFEYVLLTDARFGWWVSALTGLTPAQLAANYDFANQIALGVAPTLTALNSNRGVEIMANVISWINYFDQLGVVVLIALSRFKVFDLLKHALLIIFILGTYLFAPVIGFGWLICIWGFAMTRPEQYYLRAAYVACYIIIASYTFFGAYAGMLF